MRPTLPQAGPRTPQRAHNGYGRRPVGPWYELHRAGIAATIVDIVARGYASLAWDLPRAERVLTTGGQMSEDVASFGRTP